MARLMGRSVAIAATWALAVTMLGAPGVAAARMTSASDAAGPAPHKAFRVQSGLVAAATDDDVPGVAKTLPFTASDTLTDLTDVDDVYAFSMNTGDRLVVTLEGPGSSNIEPLLYAPGTSSVSGSEDPIGWSSSSGAIKRFVYFADSSGTYYLDAYLASGLGGAYTVSAGIDEAADDEIPGISSALPFSVTNTLGFGTDMDDVYGVDLDAGQTISVSMTGDAGTDFDVDILDPEATSVWADLPVAGSETAGTSTESFLYTATTSGTHYILVYVAPASPSGSYTLNASASAKAPTSITIKTNATTARIGGIPILSGAVTPQAMIGVNIVCYVKKPGKTYWTYSSNRTVYNLNGSPAWQYKYYFKPGMAKGIYTFKATAPAPGFANSAPFLTSNSPTTVRITLK